MNPGLFLLIAVGGGVGASVRFTLDGIIMRRAGGTYPWGTFVINTSGAILLGFLTGMADSSVLDAQWMQVLGVGCMGGYTTFSTAMVDTVHMLQKQKFSLALGNSIGMLVLTVLGAWLGLMLGRGL
ncbi:fluoride efflux transporter CrcB [Microbacterium luticocti]|uniref:fluoride efflux transporter CrcB n=1 Tax=Microbacterium luticocti TaxID=451764 RepID=UPI00040CB64E|nr:fluoride efflux transporter CrcB [Microbacterium luticocti]